MAKNSIGTVKQISKFEKVASSTEKLSKTLTKQDAINAHHVKDLDLNALSKAGQAPDRAGLTKAERALDKHGNRNPTPFPKATSDAQSKNIQRQFQLDDILTHQDKD